MVVTAISKQEQATGPELLPSGRNSLSYKPIRTHTIGICGSMFLIATDLSKPLSTAELKLLFNHITHLRLHLFP